MRRIPVPHVLDQVHRHEGAAQTLVLRHVAALVLPHRGRRLAGRDDDVAKGDRGVATPRQDETRQTSIGQIQKRAITEDRARAREDPERVPDRISVVRDERAEEP
jgi:hypothetical protein